MRVLASLLILASACTAFNANQPARSAVSRRGFFNGVTSAAVAISIATPSAAQAKGVLVLPPINGVYSDPNHKNGYRVVRAVNKSNVEVTLQDEPNGPIISVNGKIKSSKKAGTTLTLDLSPKGGPKDVVATVAGNNDQLTFPDGNAWTKLPGLDGIYSDPNHPTGYRIVRSQGGKIVVTLQDEPNGEVIELKGRKRGSNNLMIDFSPKGGPKNLAAAAKDGELVFPDGNAWTKL